MPDPHVLTDMAAAAERIADAVVRPEQVAIFGDYDVDGATATALLARFLRLCGSEPLIHIPDRIFEGYGPNVEAIRSLAQRGEATHHRRLRHHEPRAAGRSRQARARHDRDIDHHQADERLPGAVAVINPNRLVRTSGLAIWPPSGSCS